MGPRLPPLVAAEAHSYLQLSFLQWTTDSLDGNSLIRCEEAHEPRKGSPACAQAHKITSSPLPLFLGLKCGAILSSYSLLTLPHNVP